MNNDTLWLIEGYLLDDPTIDRQEFEQQMLDDPALALLVAEVAERLDLLASVARQQASHSVSTLPNSSHTGSTLNRSTPSNSALPSKSTQFSRRFLFVVLATSAAVLIAVVPALSNRRSSRLDDLALNWLALASEVSIEQDASTPTVSMVVESDIASSDASDSHNGSFSPAPAINDNASNDHAANEDWLLDNALIFFSDSGL